MNRAQRRFLAKGQNGQKVCNEMYQAGYEYANYNSTACALIMAAVVLHDKFGWGCQQGAKRLKRFLQEVGELAECINQKTVDIDELKQMLIDEGFDELESVKTSWQTLTEKEKKQVSK